jgi:hypothetical protein
MLSSTIVIKVTHIKDCDVSTIAVQSPVLVHFETVTFHNEFDKQTREQRSYTVEEALYHHARHEHRVIMDKVRWV